MAILRKMHTLKLLGDWKHLGPEKLSEAAQVSVRTAQRWIQTGMAPANKLLWLDLHREGHLGNFSPAWEGWHVRMGALWTPQSVPLEPSAVANLPTLQEHYRALHIEVLQLRAIVYHAAEGCQATEGFAGVGQQYLPVTGETEQS